jgi:SAM-dependent methyltransferase
MKGQISMNNSDYTFEDKHGKCLCTEGMLESEVVTTETREGKGLWVRCKKCGLVLNQTGVSKEEVDNFYNEAYQKNNSFNKGSVVTPREHYELAMHSMRPVAEHLEQYLQPAWKVMDIGAATGEFLDLIKGQVDYCLGIELNREYCDFMKEELSIDSTYKDYFAINYEGQFDLIVINATLDHMYNPLGVLDKIYRDLKLGGMLYIQTVNDHQALKEFLPEKSRKLFKKFMYQRAHYLSFSEQVLRDTVERIGFEVIDLHSRHDYTLNNFLNWYYTGNPQNAIFNAKIDTRYYPREDAFSAEMNELMKETDEKFHKLLSKHMAGEMLCLTAVKTEVY